VHGNLRLSSIFTSESGEWKVSGLEVLTNLKEDENAIFVMSPEVVLIQTYGSLLPDSGRYASPEIRKSSWNVIKEFTLDIRN
jgi:SCY1-like protein 1